MKFNLWETNREYALHNGRLSICKCIREEIGAVQS